MDSRYPCPCCGAPVRLAALFCWNRLLAMKHMPKADAVQFPCPECLRPLTYPLDLPLADA